MGYNFDETIERRGTNCLKWDGLREQFGRSDLLAMWIADADFACPNPILDTISKRLKHPILGYSFPPESCYRAIIDKAYRDYGWRVEKEWIVFTNGVVSGVYNAVAALANPGDNVIIQEPAYFAFYSIIKSNLCEVNPNPLRYDGDGYRMDVENLRERFDGRTKALIFCNPHNPTGRVWTEDEVGRVGEACMENDCIIISDEIHNDVVYPPNRHSVFAQLGKEFADRTITFWSASKTFNVPGLSTAFAIIPNEEIRERFRFVQMGQNGGNELGYIALEEGYRNCSDYKKQLINYVAENISYFIKRIGREAPIIKVVKPEGTYLLWVDMRGLGMGNEELNDFLINKCRIALSDGKLFGDAYGGFQRLNMACPRKKVVEVVDKFVEEIRRM